MEHLPPPFEDTGEKVQIVRQLGAKVFELSDGNFAIVGTAMPQAETKTVLSDSNQELFPQDESASMAPYETMITLPRADLIEVRGALQDMD